MSHCAHGSPLLSAARLPRAREVLVEAGGSYLAPVAEDTLRPALEASTRASAGQPLQDSEREALVRAAAAYGVTSAGSAAYLSVRGSVARRTEMRGALLGLSTLRIGARQVLWQDADDKWTLTLAGHLRAGLLPLAYTAATPSNRVQNAWLTGVDAHVQLGRTSSELYDLYVAASLSYTYAAGAMQDPAVFMGQVFRTQLHRVDLGATMGLRLGVGRLSAIFELTAMGTGFVGTAEPTAQTLTGVGFSLLPAGALGVTF
ncbi:MAG: hypothetical protein Q8Q09_00530 [Deltaproteobacteria bacterium]|nr:hypothetical protein [Deltaproteobacteria bacterium]